MYMNADYIGREFTRAVGQKFSSYLLGIRMEHAKSLMRADRSLHSYEIAEKVGLGDNPTISASCSVNIPVQRLKTTAVFWMNSRAGRRRDNRAFPKKHIRIRSGGAKVWRALSLAFWGRRAKRQDKNPKKRTKKSEI